VDRLAADEEFDYGAKFNYKRNLFQLLDVSVNSSEQEIKANFRAKSLQSQLTHITTLH